MGGTWQYKVEHVEAKGLFGGKVEDNVVEDRLNRLGAEGWELVSTASTTGDFGGTQKVIFIFKRLR